MRRPKAIWVSPRSTLGEIERQLILIFAHCHQHILDYSCTKSSVYHPRVAFTCHIADMSLVMMMIAMCRGCDGVAAPHNGREMWALWDTRLPACLQCNWPAWPSSDNTQWRRHLLPRAVLSARQGGESVSLSSPPPSSLSYQQPLSASPRNTWSYAALTLSKNM